MTGPLLPEIKGPSSLPDFGNGEHFLLGVRSRLRRGQRRRVVLVSALSTVSAVLLFVVSFSAIQRQLDEELWESYLLSEVEQVVDDQEFDEFTWELYIESLLQEENLDQLLNEILSLENGEEWIGTINVEG